MNVRFKPSIRLDQIHEPEHIFIAGASPNARRWIPNDAALLDLITGAFLVISGEMVYVCSSSASNPAGLQLLQDAGLAIPGEIFRFLNSADYGGLLQSLTRKGRKLVLQHVHPVSEVPSDNCWVSPSALSFVNNKGNLAKMVNTEDMPERRVVKSSRIKEELSSASLPQIVKAVTNETSGCGADVMICRTKDEISRTEAYFQACAYVVIEEYLVIKRNLCLHYAVDQVGCVIYLGCTEQVCDDRGYYDGNWIEKGLHAPPEAVTLGLKAAKEGYRLGYYGFVGMDMAVLENGRVLVFDLNFRVNGSTPALLLTESVNLALKKTVMRLKTIPFPGDYRRMLKVTYEAMKKDMLLPLCSLDPEAGGDSLLYPRLRCLILGDTREEVFDNEQQLIKLGFLIEKSMGAGRIPE